MNLSALLDHYQVDQPHARQVATLALELFDAVADRYKLPTDQRHLVEIGALLHNVGLAIDPAAHHLVGRDIVLRQRLPELTPREQAIVACIVAFHRKKVRPELEPAYLALGKRGQREALQLAAIVRVADGLDYAQAQNTSLCAVEPVKGKLLLRLDGPHALGDGARALTKANLWTKVFDEALTVDPILEPQEAPAESDEMGEANVATLTPWYAASDAPLAELGRVLLRRYLRRLLSAQQDVRADKEIEAVHALRVATRRLRATLKLLQPVYREGDLRDYTRALGRLARVAGAVRDRDVLIADLVARAATMPEPLTDSLKALTEALRQQRQSAHAKLLAFLDDPDRTGFVRPFARAMNDPEHWDNRPRVRDGAGSTLWAHYEALRSHDRSGVPEVIEAIHAMRIDGKRMRYVLELFADTLGTRADEAVKPLVAFQDHLGALNDIAVANELLAAHAKDERTGPAVAAYLELREHEGQRLLHELPGRWDKLNSGTYRRRLMEIIVRL